MQNRFVVIFLVVSISIHFSRAILNGVHIEKSMVEKIVKYHYDLNIL